MVSNYCATGTDAFRCGVMSIAAGVYDTVLVVGYDKPKDRGVSGPSVMMNAVRDLPQTPAGWFSLCAATYFEKYGATREDLGRIAIKNHHNGTLAPNSFLKREITMDEYLAGAASSPGRSASTTAPRRPTARRRPSSRAPISPRASARTRSS